MITDQMWQKLSVRARKAQDASRFCGSGIWLKGVYQRTGGDEEEFGKGYKCYFCFESLELVTPAERW